GAGEHLAGARRGGPDLDAGEGDRHGAQVTDGLVAEPALVEGAAEDAVDLQHRRVGLVVEGVGRGREAERGAAAVLDDVAAGLEVVVAQRHLVAAGGVPVEAGEGEVAVGGADDVAEPTRVVAVAGAQDVGYRRRAGATLVARGRAAVGGGAVGSVLAV